MGICSSGVTKKEKSKPQESLSAPKKQAIVPIIPQKKPKPRHANYEIFDSITYEHKMKDYKKPNDQNQTSKQYDMYAPHIDIYANNEKALTELDSEQYFGSDFSDKDYLDSIPKKKSASGVKFDETKTMFFKAGHSPMYSESILILLSHNDNDTIWVDIEDPSYRVNKKVTYARNEPPFAVGPYEKRYIMQAGWFVMIGNKWSFLLNLDSITEAYQGHLHKRWKILLQQQFFLDMVERFGGCMEDLQLQMQGEEIGVLPREIPTTDFDPLFNEGFLWKGLHDQLFLHQKQEVGWMFNFENYPAIKMKQRQNAMPFLDTGYYIDSNNLNEFLNPDSTEDFVDFLVPGGILASQIGSGHNYCFDQHWLRIKRFKGQGRRFMRNQN